MRSCIAIGVALVGALGCGSEVQPPPVRNLDRPSEIAFTCFGDHRVDGTVIRTAQPVENCIAYSDPNIPIPAGQENLVAPTMHAFVLQSGKGTLAVINSDVNAVLDSDPLTPGKNAIPVGTLPVDLAADPTGCFMMTANAGSCDLSILSVNSALDNAVQGNVQRVALQSGGQTILPKPRAIAVVPDDITPGQACAAAPTHPVYVALPGCNAVAAVDPANGDVLASITYEAGGNITVSRGAALACDAQCGTGTAGASADDPQDGTVPVFGGGVGGAPRPVTLEISPEGDRLYVAAENSNVLSIVTLEPDFLPTDAQTVQAVPLDGSVGITRISLTDTVGMGGEGGLGNPAGDFRFVYAIATDRTIRVVSVLGASAFECDTQVDPRLVRTETDLGFLACMPVGDAATPARRPGAVSPGIQLPVDLVPLDVAFSRVGEAAVGPPGTVAPTNLRGYFGFVAASDGNVYVVNVDDDIYPDIERSQDPLAVDISLALAHQLRDGGRERDLLATSCANGGEDPGRLGPRLAQNALQQHLQAFVASDHFFLLPRPRNVLCTGTDSGGANVQEPVSELSFAAPATVRETAYPDLQSVLTESWFVTYEGPLEVDTPAPGVVTTATRFGPLRNEGGALLLDDGARRFCASGVEEFDIVSILGCDRDEDCGLGETCFRSADQPASISRGLCVPESEADTLGGLCRDFLVTTRRYTVQSVNADQLRLVPRRRVLRTTPLAGCVSNEQCEAHYDEELRLAEPGHPVEVGKVDPGFEPMWSCEADPSRAPGIDRCVMRCDENAERPCEDGFVCSEGVCVEGNVPPAECLQAVQRYALFAGESFSVVGQRSGYLHNRIASGDSCITDPSGHPLNVGRFPLIRAQDTGVPGLSDGRGLPDCTDLPDSPNPCRLTEAQSDANQHIENFLPFAFDGNSCTAGDEGQRARSAPGVRFSNRVFSTQIVDVETTGDLNCRADGLGELDPYSPVYSGYQVSLAITGGFFPAIVSSQAFQPAFPATAVEGPDKRIWVLDQGDRSTSTRGTVFTLQPEAAVDGYGVVEIR